MLLISLKSRLLSLESSINQAPFYGVELVVAGVVLVVDAVVVLVVDDASIKPSGVQHT